MDHFTLLLNDGRLNEAFDYIENSLAATKDVAAAAGLRAEIERLRQSYRYMSQYMLDGLPDPGRQEQYEDITEGLRSVGEHLRRLNELPERPTLYYNVARTLAYNPAAESLPELLARYRELTGKIALAPLTEDASAAVTNLTAKAEQTLTNIFNRLWVTFPMSAAEAEAVSGALADEAFPRYAKLQWISGLMMGLLEFFDVRRMLILIDCYESADREIALRALAAMTVVLWRHRKRVLPRRVSTRLELLKDKPLRHADVATVALQFIRARDTERITRKFNEEIMPEMMKLRPELDRMRPSAPASPEEFLDENPEWTELLEKSGMADRLKEMQEMQEEGGDVMMATFSQLKSFPFFNEIANWFLPFHSSHSLFLSLPPEMTDMVEAMTSINMLCDTDRYSALLSVHQIPKSQRDLILSQLKMQSEHLDMVKASGALTRDKRDEEIVTVYVRDLYRFFKLFRRKGEFADPFADGINPVEIPWFRDIFEADDELMLTIAEFYFKRRYMADALKVFQSVAERTAPDATLYQKMGYCYEAQGLYADAVRLYDQSELLNASSRWTMRHLAVSHRMLGDWENALRYYNLLAAAQPDDPATALNVGLCLVKLRRFDEALPHLFKAEFLGNQNVKSLRAIAWCTLLRGDLERATRYIGKLLEAVDTPTANDLLNAGHIALADGRLNEAVNFYARSIAAREFDIASFITDFDADASAVGPLAAIPHIDLMIARDAAISLSGTLGQPI